MHVIYGGTFDPIHHGHLRLAVELRERLGVPEVSLMPCHVPPHRDQPGATSEQRVALLKLAIADEPGLALDDRELGRDGASYTAETLRQVRAELGPHEPLTMVLGTDSFAGFDRWQEWQRIPELAHIVVVRRPGPGLAPGSVPERLLQERRVDSVEALYGAPCGHILELDPPLLDISATGVRERILSGRSPRYLLPDSVWQEIRHRRLYGA
ncbi:nicotinate-nucleotide adenylyltransferase [Marinobacter sp. HL-58]|uniref:nicotinate-nucleotide adenylyltransferase n=1 Tax=Marinobacter sp. HL-58 TaxID=1479237 RepID=UPI0004803B35|nr:nicotinate-nucleotide adenylyltransferase [Marinobacter sp. HL-58]KPP98227.1 MAG: nicotinate-nucleotide adenylyltransferase NadD [Marinobacter sp. HL-58]